MLAMNIVYRGFSTDPNIPGAEKLVMTSVDDRRLGSARQRISASDVEATASLLPPQVAFAAKGWNRSVGCLLALCACYELGDLMMKARQKNETCYMDSKLIGKSLTGIA